MCSWVAWPGGGVKETGIAVSAARGRRGDHPRAPAPPPPPRRTIAVQRALLATLIRGDGAGIRPIQHGRAVRGNDRPRQRGAAVVAQRA